jgi:hypothetical protein
MVSPITKRRLLIISMLCFVISLFLLAVALGVCYHPLFLVIYGILLICIALYSRILRKRQANVLQHIAYNHGDKPCKERNNRPPKKPRDELVECNRANKPKPTIFSENIYGNSQNEGKTTNDKEESIDSGHKVFRNMPPREK